MSRDGSYLLPAENEWVRPVENGYRMRCCDCKLVHEMDFRVTDDGRAEFRVRRNNRATALSRYWDKRRAEPGQGEKA